MTDLSRFHNAQEQSFETALAELRAGKKRTHWMWYIFPQIAGLGSSDMAQRYALSSLDEARAFLADPVLGVRIRAVTTAMLRHAEKTAHEILGSPDDMKFFSSMTLFHLADKDEKLFKEALDVFFAGKQDQNTLNKV